MAHLKNNKQETPDRKKQKEIPDKKKEREK